MPPNHSPADNPLCLHVVAPLEIRDGPRISWTIVHEQAAAHQKILGLIVRIGWRRRSSPRCVSASATFFAAPVRAPTQIPPAALLAGPRGWFIRLNLRVTQLFGLLLVPCRQAQLQEDVRRPARIRKAETLSSVEPRPGKGSTISRVFAAAADDFDDHVRRDPGFFSSLFSAAGARRCQRAPAAGAGFQVPELPPRFWANARMAQHSSRAPR